MCSPCDADDGCSDGGREAMEMAERYPNDFNGIIAGAPEIIAGPLNAELQTATDTITSNTVTRPVYPYPLVPKYNGTGSTSDAANFHPVVSPHAKDHSNWIGNYLFYQPIGGSGLSRHSRSRKA
jgi:hypothetical protein